MDFRIQIRQQNLHLNDEQCGVRSLIYKLTKPEDTHDQLGLTLERMPATRLLWMNSLHEQEHRLWKKHSISTSNGRINHSPDFCSKNGFSAVKSWRHIRYEILQLLTTSSCYTIAQRHFCFCISLPYTAYLKTRVELLLCGKLRRWAPL